MKADATNHKISWIKREADAETLDFSPSFQRRPVWDDDQASFLIDSILNDFPVPEIYLRSFADDEGNDTHEVIDGQQRIRSILRFAEGDLALEGDQVGERFRGATISDLTPEQRSAFYDYKLVVREIGSATDVEVRELFRRVNLNSVVLNDQELRHAQLDGKFITLVEELADDKTWLEVGLFTVREIRRMLDVEYMAELLVGLMAGPQDKKKTLDDYFNDYDKDFPDASFWRRVFTRTYSLIEELAPDRELRKWSRSKSEFYSLFLALGNLVYEGTRWTQAEKDSIADALSEFRTAVDAAKRRDNSEVFQAEIHEYAEAVTRAASDLSRRNRRDQVLTELIKSAIA